MEKTFAYHKPSENGLERIKTLRTEFSALHEIVRLAAPESRERSVALTNLEQAAMWAIKAVVHNDVASVVEE